MGSAWKADPLPPLAGVRSASVDDHHRTDDGLSFNLEAMRRAAYGRVAAPHNQVDGLHHHTSIGNDPSHPTVVHIKDETPVGARRPHGASNTELQARADLMKTLMGTGTTGGISSGAGTMVSATNDGVMGPSVGVGTAGKKAGGKGGPAITSFKDYYHPGNRHFGFPPVRAARARKAAMGSDFEIYSNLAMEHIEKTAPWTKAYLHSVSPFTFGVVATACVVIVAATVLFGLLDVGNRGVAYYNSLIPPPPPPPIALSAPVNPARDVAGCPDTSIREPRAPGMPSGWVDSCKTMWDGKMHFRDIAGPYVGMLPVVLPDLEPTSFKTMDATVVSQINPPAPPVDDATLLAMPTGDLVAAFVFRPVTLDKDRAARVGREEAVGITAIATSRLNVGSNTWSDPEVIAKFSKQALLRPSFHYETRENRVYLFFVFREVDADDSESRVGWLASSDGGKTWGSAKENVGLSSGPTKGPWIAGGGGGIVATATADGGEEWLMAQSFIPDAVVWKSSDVFVKGGLEQHYSLVKASRDLGRTWTLRGFMSRPYDVLADPVVVRLKDGTLRAFFNDRKHLALHVSDDQRNQGRFWQLWPTKTRLPSGPGGIAAAVMPRSGRLVLAFNNHVGDEWGGVLSLAVSEDGGATFPWVRDLEPDAKQGDGAVTPPASDGQDALFLSEGSDGRRRESRAGRKHFYGNPTVAGTMDGRLHVLYTFRGRAVKHVIVDEAWVMAGGTGAEKLEAKDERLSKGVFKGDTENVADPNVPAVKPDDPRVVADPAAKPQTGGVRPVPCCQRARDEEAEEVKEELLAEVAEMGRK